MVYARSCSGCHTLVGHESGAEGGDLLNARLSVTALASFAEAMPVYPALTHGEALSVARFIHDRRPRPPCLASARAGGSHCRLTHSQPE
jgi:mono/diheme cytochrome c family protein